jgi:regulator of RNase E activity RraA
MTEDQVLNGRVAALLAAGAATVWGDILTEYAASHYLAGTAIWGVSLAEVADLATEIATREDAILAAIPDGATIADARKQHGYHTLQRKEK